MIVHKTDLFIISVKPSP